MFQTVGRHSSQTCDFSTKKLHCTKLLYHWYPKVEDLPFLPPPTQKKYVNNKFIWDSISGIRMLQPSREYLQFKTLTARLSYWSCRYIFIGKFVTSRARAASTCIRREITITILFTFLVLLSRLV